VVTPGPDAEAWPCGSDRCCELRKVVPLNGVLEGRDAWMTGLKRVDTPARASTPIVKWDSARGLVKVNPIARWTDNDVTSHEADHNLPVHPLIWAGLSVHRLPPDDASGLCVRGPTSRALARYGQDGMRFAPLTSLGFCRARWASSKARLDREPLQPEVGAVSTNPHPFEPRKAVVKHAPSDRADHVTS